MAIPRWRMTSEQDYDCPQANQCLQCYEHFDGEPSNFCPECGVRFRGELVVEQKAKPQVDYKKGVERYKNESVWNVDTLQQAYGERVEQDFSDFMIPMHQPLRPLTDEHGHPYMTWTRCRGFLLGNRQLLLDWVRAEKKDGVECRYRIGRRCDKVADDADLVLDTSRVLTQEERNPKPKPMTISGTKMLGQTDEGAGKDAPPGPTGSQPGPTGSEYPLQRDEAISYSGRGNYGFNLTEGS